MLRTSLKRCYGLLSSSASIKHRHFHNTIATLTVDESVTIGNVTVDRAPRGDRPDLIPKLPSRLNSFDEVLHTTSSLLPPCHLSHLRWMLQKDLVLKQDFLLLGTPNLARERRHLILLYAALLGREVEYVSLSRDTSEADLKQRKEVSNSGTIYVNQAPVRAALHGRLLIIDGIEKAERNVLPTLNNLLENRELPLDDGSMLVSPDVYNAHKMGLSVHPDFRVAALGSLGRGGEAATLDPPLRSRFQARLASSVGVGDTLVAASAGSNGLLDAETLKHVVELVGEVPDGVSLQSVHDAIRYIERNQQSISSPRVALNAHGINNSNNDGDSMIKANDILSPLKLEQKLKGDKISQSLFVETKTTKVVRDLIIAGFESGNRAVACVGPKGCYKSALARQTALLASRTTKKRS